MLTKRQIIAARREAVDKVTAAFLPVERGADSTAAAASRCVAALIEERAACALPPNAAAQAIRLVHEGSQLAFEAQAKFREAHEMLAGLPTEFGFVAYVPDCPPNEGKIGAEPLLSLVKTA